MNKNVEDFANFKKSIIGRYVRSLIFAILHLALQTLAITLVAVAIARGVTGWIGAILVILAATNGALIVATGLPRLTRALYKYTAAKKAARIMDYLFEELGDEVFDYDVEIEIEDEIEDEI